jgi:DNA polymerase III sliding clamp (beta) subunit (PCNA family)
MSIDLSKGQAKAIALAMNSERTRYAFDGARIGTHGDATVVVATDGKRLHAVKVDGAPDTDTDGSAFPGLLPRAALDSVVKIAPRKRDVANVTCNGTVKVEGKEMRSEHQPIEGSFPNFGPLLDKELDHSCAVDARYLRDACDAALQAGDDDDFGRVLVRIEFTDENTAVRLVAEPFTAMIMPVCR